MKTLIIYYLNEPQYTKEELNKLADELDMFVFQFKADNQIEHAQYPIIDLVEL